MAEYILAHDMGTSGNKAVLYNVDNRKIITHAENYPLLHPESGMAEQDSELWWQAVCVSTRRIIQKAGIDSSEITSVSFSAIMNSLLPVDSAGNPLRNAMIWADNRSGAEAEQILKILKLEEIYSITGHRLDSRYFLSKMMWFRDNEPELYKRTRFFLQAKDFLAFRLTGNFITDFSDASHLGCFDIRRKDWSDEILSGTGFGRDKLPEIICSTDRAGTVTADAASLTGLKEGTPVYLGGGDGCCATAGAGVYKQGQAYTVLGTSAWTASLTESIIPSEDMVTFYFVHLDGKHYVPCGTMQSAGHSFKWAAEQFYAAELAEMGNAAYAGIEADTEGKEPGAGGLIYLPYLLGERSPWWNDKAKGCFLGLSAMHDRSDMVHAVLEGVAVNLGIIVGAIEKQTGRADMKIIGGGATNRRWLSIIADVFGRDLYIPEYVLEATSLGAILCAGIGSGIFRDFSEAERINPVERVVEYDASRAEQYKLLSERFSLAYRAVEGLFKD